MFEVIYAQNRKDALMEVLLVIAITEFMLVHHDCVVTLVNKART
jgi:hypothetical protein